MPLISTLIILPLITAGVILLIKNEKSIKLTATLSSFLNLIMSSSMFLNAGKGIRFEEKYVWIKSLNINIHFGVDNLSILMIALTNLLIPIAVMSSYSYIKHNIKKYYFWLMILHSSIIGVFSSLDAILFYVFWEMVLIPMYFLIGIWGGQNRVYASIKFFIYTLAGSVFFLVGIIIIYVNLKSNGNPTFEILEMSRNTLPQTIQTFVFFSFFFAFAIKTPLIPLHTWLPDAHVEAPTAASVILAGILLKMGGYGFLRFLIPTFPELSLKYSHIISTIGALAVVYAGLMAWMQTDIKKLIAYSSISHMGLVTLGIFSLNQVSLNGAILQMINHGISSAGLFLVVGIIYERTHTRNVYDFGGLFKITPFFATFFMIILLSSIGFPSTNGFVGELLTIQGSFKSYKSLSLLSISGVIIGAVYMLLMYERVFFGEIKISNVKDVKDLNIREWVYLSPIVIFIFLIGLYPDLIIPMINDFTINLIDGVIK